MWFDGDSVRSFVTVSHPKWTRVYKTIVAGDVFISEWSDKDRVETGDRRSVEAPDQVQNAFDPRVLGLVNGSLGLHYTQQLSWKSLLPELGEFNEPVREKLDGIDLIRLESRRENQVFCTWFDPARGYNVVRMEMTISGSDGSRFEMITTVDLEKLSSPPLWFPRKLQREEYRSGELSSREIVKVEKAEFNIDVPKITFTFAGMQLPPGRKVIFRPNSLLMVWDGSKLVGEVVKAPPTIPSR